MTVRTSTPARRVFLHVGSPKTGTTFLQNVLWSQRRRAAEQGVLLPGERFADHYLASLDVRGLADRPEHPEQAAGMWSRLVAEAERWSGTVLISHELFAATTAEQAAAAVGAFAADTEVHVVVTARDLVRQIPAEWQEHVKHRSTTTLPAFIDRLRRDDEGRSWFWQVQDFAGVLERWRTSLPAAQLHVVTVPQAGADPDTLWNRFASLLGLDPTSFDTRRSRANTSLHVEQAELLRRLNASLGEDQLRLPGPYPLVVKNVLAHQVLTARPGTRLVLDADAVEFAVERSAEIAGRLGAMGVDVVGDLAELVPAPETATLARDGYPEPSAEVLLEESIAAMVGLLETLARDRAALRRHQDLVRDLRQRPVAFALVRASEHNRALMAARRVYKRLTTGRGR